MKKRLKEQAIIKQSRTENGREDFLWLDYLIEPSILKTFLERCKNILSDEANEEPLQKMNEEIFSAADQVWEDIKSDIPGFDCRKGCSWCCHQSVSVTWPELLDVLRYLRQTLSRDDLVELRKKSKDKANEILEKFDDGSNGSFHKISCLFLKNNICTIHESRPLQCRGGFSEEETYCKSLLEDTKNTQNAVETGNLRGKFLIAPKLIFNSAQVAMTYAMKDIGLEGATYEFTVAISILIKKLCDGEADSIIENDLKPALLPQNFNV